MFLFFHDLKFSIKHCQIFTKYINFHWKKNWCWELSGIKHFPQLATSCKRLCKLHGRGHWHVITFSLRVITVFLSIGIVTIGIIKINKASSPGPPHSSTLHHGRQSTKTFQQISPSRVAPSLGKRSF